MLTEYMILHFMFLHPSFQEAQAGLPSITLMQKKNNFNEACVN